MPPSIVRKRILAHQRVANVGVSFPVCTRRSDSCLRAHRQLVCTPSNTDEHRSHFEPQTVSKIPRVLCHTLLQVGTLRVNSDTDGKLNDPQSCY